MEEDCMETRIEEIARLLIDKLLAVRREENVMIIVDEDSEMRMARSLFNKSKSVGGNPIITIMPSNWHSHTTLPKPIQKSLEATDVVIGMTRRTAAPSYDPIVAKLLREKRIRYMSMVLRPLDNYINGAALADYDEVYKMAEKLADKMHGSRIKVVTSLGTNIEASIEGSKVIIEAGFATKPGESAAFSDGEVSYTPIEGTANGVVVVDGPIAYIGKPEKPVTLKVKEGRVIGVEGGREAEILRRMIEETVNLDNFAEFGIGVNRAARRNGYWQEEKKAWGNLHIALGDNIYYGGKVKCDKHMDLVIYNSTVTVDDKVILKEGKLLI
ncbi:MAG: aminopeptidase [archaeon GB-1867-097]|nr:aminopeptidase [Candidatus Culexmicrobium thermophilum]